MLKVKICGITNLKDAFLASYYGADAVGFIFSKKSPRYITIKTAKKIISQLGPFVAKVGVFLDERREKVFDIASYLKLDTLQFHGQEIPSYCRFFRPRFKVIKTIFPQDKPFIKKISLYDVDAFLFDVKYEEKIRNRSKLSNSILKEIGAFVKKKKKIIISGGLNAANIVNIKKLKPYAVDVARGVERSIGRKDERLMKLFLKRAKQE